MLRKLMVASTVALAITALSTPAQAGVRVGIGIGIPVGGWGYGGYGYGPYYRPYPYYYYPYGPAPYYYPPAYAPAPVYAPGYPAPAAAYAPQPAPAYSQSQAPYSQSAPAYSQSPPAGSSYQPAPSSNYQPAPYQPGQYQPRLLRDTARPVRRATRRPLVSLRSRRRCNPRQTSGSGPRDRFVIAWAIWSGATAEPPGFSRVGEGEGCGPSWSAVRQYERPGLSFPSQLSRTAYNPALRSDRVAS